MTEAIVSDGIFSLEFSIVLLFNYVKGFLIINLLNLFSFKDY